jgi:hypothetical protein
MGRWCRLIPPLSIGFWPFAAEAQRLGGGGGDPELSLARILAALAVCLATAVAAALLVRRRRPNGGLPLPRPGWLSRAVAGARRIEVVETRRLSPFADVCLVRCDGAEYLLLCGPAGQSVLRRPDAARSPPERDGDAR